MKQGIQMRWLATRDLLSHYGAVFSHVWKQRRVMDQTRHTRDEAEFLPAALSLQESPVSPAPRVAMWLLVSFAALALFWSILGQVDIVATAHGKIVPGDRTKVIQPMETAAITRIHVTDGQVVKAGDVLIELDATSAEADVDRVHGDRVYYELQAARSLAMLAALRSGKVGALGTVVDADASQVAEARRLLDGQYAEFHSKLVSLDIELTKREAELQSTRALVRKLELTAPIAKQRADDYRKLVEANFVSQHGYLEREQQRIEQEADLENLRGRTHEILASIREAQADRDKLITETQRVALDGLIDARQHLGTLKQERIKADSRAQSMRLTSPVDGVVQQLDVHTIGGVVTPAQKLMVVVPQDGTLEVEAFLENKDIGFIRVGQQAAVKVEAFEYTKYGTIPAVVTQVSGDAISDEKRGLIYATRVKLDRASVPVGDRMANLAPGMEVSVEIKTGARRVIEYFLSPLIQYTSESLKER